MSSKPHRTTRTARTRSRKFSGRCESCGKPLCSCRAYQYTDESNGAITANAPYLCRDCYETRYGVKIPTEVDAYKARLLGVLVRYADRTAPLNRTRHGSRSAAVTYFLPNRSFMSRQTSHGTKKKSFPIPAHTAEIAPCWW